MGTHLSNPSFIKATNNLLSEHLQKYTACHKADLLFLFKILSVNTALSIQAHPHKELAIHLHKTNPEWYKDPNHKPEMAIALTPFEALCGFLPPEKLIQNLEENVVFCSIVHSDHLSALKKSFEQGNLGKDELKRVFQDLFELDSHKEKLKETIEILVQRIMCIPEEKRTNHQKLAVKLREQYGNDVGILVSFLMNYVHLNPGEGFAINPDEPHAYISGDCIECMATSDNVVRCGLTPKVKDIKTLTDV